MGRRDVYTSVVLDRGHGDRLYRQIAAVLGKEIRTRFRAADLLPSEAVLARRFGVNRHTLRHAIEVLMAEGLVARRHGHGTVVMQAMVRYPVGATTRFSTTIEAQGRWPDTRLLSAQEVPATPGVARRLALRTGAPVTCLEILRLMDARPVSISAHFVVPALVPGLTATYQGGSLHALLHDRYGLDLGRIESLITAILPLGDDARLLEIPRDRPVLRVKSVNVRLKDRRPVEYVLSRFRSDCIALQVDPLAERPPPHPVVP